MVRETIRARGPVEIKREEGDTTYTREETATVSLLSPDTNTTVEALVDDASRFVKDNVEPSEGRPIRREEWEVKVNITLRNLIDVAFETTYYDGPADVLIEVATGGRVNQTVSRDLIQRLMTYSARELDEETLREELLAEMPGCEDREDFMEVSE